MKRRDALVGSGAAVLVLVCPQIAWGATIFKVRVWPAPEYSRVTIESDAALQTHQLFVANPPRLAVDIEGIVLNPALRELVAKVRPDDPNIAGIRVGQFTPNVVRLVIDLKQAIRPQVFTLLPVGSYQHRLVLDLYPEHEEDPLAALIAERTHEQPARGPTGPVGLAGASGAVGTTSATGVTDSTGSAGLAGLAAAPGAAALPAGTAGGASASIAGVARAPAAAPAAATAAAPAASDALSGSDPLGALIARQVPGNAAQGGSAPAGSAPGGVASGTGIPIGAAPMPDGLATAAGTGNPREGAAGTGTERLIIVALDPGHGGEDPGAIGPAGTREKDVVLRLAHLLRERINASNVHGNPLRAYLTRDADYFVPLGVRVQKARRVQADLFVSLHADAFFTPFPQGASVFALSPGGATSSAARWMAARENKADLIGGVNIQSADATVLRTLLDMSTTAQINDSLRLGSTLLGEIRKVGKLHKGRVEQAAFAVLKAPDIPSVLVEAAFISNPSEEQRLNSDDYQNHLADALVRGILGYFARNPPLARTRTTS